ncbi:hypothetical protein E6H29_08490 [Candidatus Bathyarchaeota archaeon]|nr:MAG: hypothetical protein E6H29_08490 [Candidatus Bathyarchaeota archaeon]
MARTATVDVDERGRVHLPASMRRELKTSRFKISLDRGRIVMEPVQPAEAVKGKYKGLLKVNMEELEESQERFVAAGRR